MSEDRLSILAIAIFSLTLGSLLGPMVGVSPAIPAGGTALLLGLVTLDRFTWQGQGLQILLERLQPAILTQRRIYHEAGHFLIALHYAIPVTGYSLNTWEAIRQGHGSEGGLQVDLTDYPLGQTQQFDRLLILAMAGIAAEILHHGEALGGENDRQQLLQLLAQTNLPPQQYGQRERWALQQAKNLLQEHSEAFTQLSQMLAQRRSVAECQEQITPLLLSPQP